MHLFTYVGGCFVPCLTAIVCAERLRFLDWVYLGGCQWPNDNSDLTCEHYLSGGVPYGGVLSYEEQAQHLKSLKGLS